MSNFAVIFKSNGRLFLLAKKTFIDIKSINFFNNKEKVLERFEAFKEHIKAENNLYGNLPLMTIDPVAVEVDNIESISKILDHNGGVSRVRINGWKNSDLIGIPIKDSKIIENIVFSITKEIS